MKIAYITGAARGIGKKIAEEFSVLGYSLALFDKDKCTEKYSYIVDVGNYSAFKNTLEKARNEVGVPTVLVNNAGFGGPFHLATEVSEAEWDLVMNTNLKSVFCATSWALPLMAKNKFGRIINIASIQGIFGAVRSSTYSTSKHAMIGYTRSVAAEWGQHGITCNAVLPGYINTAMGAQDSAIDDHTIKVIARTPTRKIGELIDVARVVTSLASSESSYVNGALWTVDGGISADVGI